MPRQSPNPTGFPVGSPARLRRIQSLDVDNTDHALGKAHELAEDEAEFGLLCPDEMEEAVDVLVGDVDWLKRDLVLFARLVDPVDAKLERHAPARFLVIILGPNDAEDRKRHIQMGEAAGMLFMDELVVRAAYDAMTPETFLDMLDLRMNKLTVRHSPCSARLPGYVDVIVFYFYRFGLCV